MGREYSTKNSRKPNTEFRRKSLTAKKKRQKIILKRISVLLFVVFVVTMLILSLTVLFPIKKITVTGESPYKSEKIVSVSGIQKGQNLWMSGRNADATLTVKLPYISSVKIKRKIPAEIVISVEKAQPSYCYKNADKYYLCDENAKLLEISKTKPEKILIINGCDISSSKTGEKIVFKNDEFGELSNKLLLCANENGIEFSQIDVADKLNVTAVLSDGKNVKFGAAGNVSEKMKHLSQMLKKLDKDVSGTVNLSSWTQEDPKGIFVQGN